jgi:deoxyribonuclease IV
VILGAHCSGGVKKAIPRGVEIGADAVQLFVQSPRAWRFPEHDPADLAAFREQRAAEGIGAVLVHAVYLVNLASPNEDFYAKSVATMRSTVDAACAIEADAVVFHVGSHQGAGFDIGLERTVPAMRQALERCSESTWLLMENSAGAGGTIGRSIDELAVLFEALDRHERLGICLDSCHLYVSGYDVTKREELDRVLDEVEKTIGLERLRVLHVNDSKAPLGSNRDRHENIGDGVLGEELGVFLSHQKLQGLPALLEVPGKEGKGPNAEQVRKLKELHARSLRSSGHAGEAVTPSGRRHKRTP